MQTLSFDVNYDYTLIGIHTIEEDYRLAYLINQKINTCLEKAKNNLDFTNKNASFCIFEFRDKQNFTDYFLIANKSENLEDSSNSETLFEETSEVLEKAVYLIPEKKKVDYFLKIDRDLGKNDMDNLINQINEIEQVITSYSIIPKSLKSKDFLIF
ncbi:IPExxxVDY family protein [Aureivirga sp. CE67]|uniref:IPExxxVDY family protein n=1 Tax=Aureivirga sp. CE67 TaxID=1788983 RepID=UPI0018CAAD1F|nr:IPExxxVDY family protein [Aureivirga sp. CE67]